MQKLPSPIPIVTVDMEAFSQLRTVDEQAAVVKRLQEVLRKSLQPLIGFADPEQILRHGTGDGYYLYLEGFSTPVAMRFALNLENFLRTDNAAHTGYPLRLRVGLTLGSVGLQGDQYLGAALTEAARLIDHPWIKTLLEDRQENPLVLVASKFFWDDWSTHGLRSHPELAYPEDRPWTRDELTVKFGEIMVAHIQVEKKYFEDRKQESPTLPRDEPSSIDLTPWLQGLLDRTRHIRIIGIGAGDGGGNAAHQYPIENLYTSLKSRNDRMTISGIGRELEEVSLAGLLPQHKRLFIEGDPGSGKTTFLHLAAAMLAKDLLGEVCPKGGSWRKEYLGMDDTRPAPKPLFLKLSDLAVFLTGDNALHGKDDRFRLLDLLRNTKGANRDPAWSSHWQSSLEAGEVLLLLDGLDEVSDAGVRERVFAIFRDAESHWPNCTMVVTSRPFAAEKLESMGFHRVVIDPFGAAETREFINRWSAALYNHPIEVEPFGEAGEKAGAMKKAILDRPAIRKLAANPVMLTCLCVVHWNRGQLPEGRSLVYKVVISWLLNSHEEIRKSHGYNNRFALEAFSAIAFAMMGGRKGNKRATFDLQETCEIVRPLVTRYFSDVGFSQVCDFISEWLRFEALHSNILLEKNKDQFGFWHLTFQEYLAAQELAWMRDDRDSGWWPVVADRLEDAQWRETIDLFPGVLLDGGGSNKVDDLLSRVQKKYSGRKLADAARMAGVMGRILEPIKVYQYRPQAEIQKRYQRVLDRAMDIFTLEGATKVPIKERLPAAEALGQGGDPRLAEDQWRKNFIKVPGTDIALGRYPVTVQEYQRFVEEGGYDNLDYWQEEHAWTFRQAGKWAEPADWPQQLDHPNRPVVGVSWCEASAYCLWLTRQKGVSIFLPDANDWEKAATPDQRDYPWGTKEPTEEHANYAGKIGSPSPVGLYPLGNGPYDHCDLAGNVGEWSRSPWTDGDWSDEDIKKFGPPKVVRGGSWLHPAGGLRAALRNGSVAGYRSVNLGFRLAAPASTVDP